MSPAADPEAAISADEIRAPAAAERVPLRTVLSWGPPVFALSSALFFLQFYFLKFATDVLLMPAALVGVIFALGRLWDAISDPIVGTWSDRTRTRIGRRRPWMFAAIPFLALSVLATWMPPASLSGVELTAWVAISLLAFYTALTMFLVPHASLGAELTTNHHDRSRVFGFQNASFMIGMMLAFPAMQYVMTSDTPRAAASQLAIASAALMLVVLVIPPILIRERPEYQGRGGQRPMHAMRDVLKNPHARRLLFVQFVQMLATGVIGILSPFMVQYVLKRPDLIGPLPAIFVICNLASIPVWVYLSRRFGKRTVWLWAMVGAGIVFGGTAFVGEGDVVLISALLPLAGFALGCGGTVGPSILADVIDGDELDTNERKEGAYNAAWGFALKVSNALVILVTGTLLQLAGYEPNVDQTDTVKLTIRVLYGVLPLTMFSCAALVMRGFKLDEREHARIRAALDARSSGAPGAPTT